jgi:hypothetical protein
MELPASPCPGAYLATYNCTHSGPTQDWFVNLELDQLPAFVKAHGRVVIEPHDYDPGAFTLEIYDDHRE